MRSREQIVQSIMASIPEEHHEEINTRKNKQAAYKNNEFWTAIRYKTNNRTKFYLFIKRIINLFHR